MVDVQCRCEVGCKRRFPDYVSPLNSKRDGWIRRAIRRLQWFLWGRSLGCDISWTAVGYGSLALDSFTFTSDYFLSFANSLIFSRFFHPEMKTRIQLRFKSSSPLRMCKQQGWQQLFCQTLHRFTNRTNEEILYVNILARYLSIFFLAAILNDGRFA